MRRDQRSLKERSRTGTLSDDEIRLVWNSCSYMGTFDALVKLLLLTSQRQAKVASMQWADMERGLALTERDRVQDSWSRGSQAA
jgi:integrase